MVIEKLAKFNPPSVIRMLLRENIIVMFLQLMGLEVPTEYEGTGTSFLASMLVVEELAKVDPSVSALVDIHNTLVVALLVKVGSEEQKKKYLPLLSRKYVSS